jgi:hypothetical protein
MPASERLLRVKLTPEEYLALLKTAPRDWGVLARLTGAVYVRNHYEVSGSREDLLTLLELSIERAPMAARMIEARLRQELDPN